MRASRRHGLAAVLAVLTTAVIGAASTPAEAARSQRSIFQDDDLLLFQSRTETARSLDVLRYLGVDTVRVSVFWNLVAPASKATNRPAFDATDSAAYPASNWVRYDQIVELAQQRGIEVDFNISPPVPAWAGGISGNSGFRGHYRPSPPEFGQFVRALGRRYSGSYVAGGATVPRVSFWSLWNEPNLFIFLAPSWDWIGGRAFEASAKTYRSLADAGYGALTMTGHGGDTILIGETSSKGPTGICASCSTRPLRFLRALYCVDSRLVPLRGPAASVQGCPPSNQAAAFPAAHPALFRATGWGQHPYQLLFAPTVPAPPDSVATADVPRLAGTLDRIFSTYRQRRRLPIYFDEYGYETDPPSEFGVSLAQQAAYINQAEYMAYGNPRVRSYAQFLLRDYENSYLYQTGLVNADGTGKPALDAYRIPIWIPATRSRNGRFRVWGLFRPGVRAGIRSATVQFRARGAARFASVATAPVVSARGYVDRTVFLPSAGSVRLAFRDPATGQQYLSRSISVRR